MYGLAYVYIWSCLCPYNRHTPIYCESSKKIPNEHVYIHTYHVWSCFTRLISRYVYYLFCIAMWSCLCLYNRHSHTLLPNPSSHSALPTQHLTGACNSSNYPHFIRVRINDFYWVIRLILCTIFIWYRAAIVPHFIHGHCTYFIGL